MTRLKSTVLSVEQLDEIRDILIENLPFAPLDFVRGISKQGSRSTHISQLTSSVHHENDFRRVSILDSGERVLVAAERLAWDSEFFGYGVAKLSGVYLLDEPYYQTEEDYAEVLKPTLQTAKDRGIRYFFAVVDARDLALMRSLSRLGFALIETRLYYHMSLNDFQPDRRYPVRIATVNDITALGETAQIMVNPYDRFHADPFIARSDADRLMYRWVEASIRECFADVTLVPDYPQPTAFCTVRYHKEKWAEWGLRLAQPVFSAVSGDYRGWYRKLISEINCHLQTIGAEHSYLATQVTNRAVVRVWESLGYRYGHCEHIFRVLL